VFERPVHLFVVCLLVVAAGPVLADPTTCTAPPMVSSTGGAGENIYHEAMQSADERGYWVVKTYPIDSGFNLSLQLDGHVRASQVDAEGNPDNTGKYVTLVNDNKVSVYFNLTPSMLNDELMPGESRRIGLGIYQTTNEPARPVSVPLTIMYWVSTGVVGAAPKRCSTHREFFMNVAKSHAVYEFAKRYISWQTYGLNFPEIAPETLNSRPASYTQYAGPIRFTYSATSAKSTLTIVNTAQTLVLMQCTGYDHVSVYQPGEPFTASQNGDPDHYGWKPVSTSCQVAVAPSDDVLPAELFGRELESQEVTVDKRH
jgi:hypothetical protein